MPDLGDLLGLAPDPAPAATRRARRARRARVRCRNPRCRRWVYVDRAVFGYGEDCAVELGLVVHRWRLADHGQVGPDLLDTLEASVTAPRRFVLRIGRRDVAEGMIFSDGAAVVYQPGVGRRIDRYPVGSSVGRKLAAGQASRLIVPEAVDGVDVDVVWLDTDPAGPAGPAEAAGASPTRTAELAEPDQAGYTPAGAEAYR